ncbi:MAG: hypothetical protein JST66_13215 [Bacteroidetes bacterium]|nr:hypothetical protein [Bacteroidota bacterium]
MIFRSYHIALLSIALLSSCTMNGSRDANEWINSLEKGMTQEEVESSKPDHVTIHWDHPIIDSLTTEYDVTYEDRTDFAPTPYFLVFRGGKYDSYGGRN